jgi:hypothetical protein
MKKYFDSFFEKICILLFIRIFQNIFTAEFGGTSCGIGASHVIWALPAAGKCAVIGTSHVISCALVGLRRYLGYAVIGASHVISCALLVLRTLLALPAAGKCALVGLRRY